MSFSNEVKNELRSLQIKMNCCRKAYLFGLLYGAESIDGERMRVTFTSCESAESAMVLLGATSQGVIRESARAGRKYFELEFTSKAFSSFIARVFHSAHIAEAAKFRCDGCYSSFARGVLEALATVSDPHKSYHLEIMLRGKESAQRADALCVFFEVIGFSPKRIKREKGEALYFKSNTAISDILSYVGAMRASFEVANTYIERDIRNIENRATNCVAKNISKSVESVRRQLAAIEKLESKNLLGTLPDELLETAKLRLEYDDVSLSELAALHDPPISKSGLNHRLDKICRAAENIE